MNTFLSIAAALIAACLSAHAAPDAPPPAHGKLLFEDALDKPLAGDWKTHSGDWTVQDGAWLAAPRAVKEHGPAAHHPLPASDCVLQIEFRSAKISNLHVAFNDEKGHVSRVLVEMDSLSVRRDSYGHVTDEVLNKTPLKLAPDAWHTLVITLRGSELTASVDGVTARASHAELAKKKTEFALGFSSKASPTQFRNLRIWEIAPAP